MPSTVRSFARSPGALAVFTSGLLRVMGLVAAFFGAGILGPGVLSGDFLGGVLLLGFPFLIVGALAFGSSAEGRRAGFGEWFAFAVTAMVGGALGTLVLLPNVGEWTGL